jgi:exodeoxyribonuclease VII large subunit
VTSRIVTVGLLSSYFRDLVESDEFLQDIWIEGEVSAWSVPGSGHAYFSIKDESSTVDCVMWRPIVARQSFSPVRGDKIVVHGSATVYEKTSRFQIKADVVYPAGAGILQLQLEQLRQRLEMEGLFDPSRKRPLPTFPRRIGVVTSPTGAVWHDIQRVIQRRYPLVELVLAPAVVQGDRAPESVVQALRQLQAESLDLVILARGGGSVEDLWAFNDERIVRAIFASTVPVVSAIGHETDISLADYVADLRAPTPSVAAELVVPDILGISDAIAELRNRAEQAALATITRHQQTLRHLQHRLTTTSPMAQVEVMHRSLASVQERLWHAARHAIERKRYDVECHRAVLAALDPTAVIGRGFAFMTHGATGATVRKASALASDEPLVATFADGTAHATVTEIRSSPHQG